MSRQLEDGAARINSPVISPHGSYLMSPSGMPSAVPEPGACMFGEARFLL